MLLWASLHTYNYFWSQTLTPETLNSKAGLVEQSSMSAGELLPPYKVLEIRDHTTYRGSIRDIKCRKGKKETVKIEQFMGNI